MLTKIGYFILYLITFGLGGLDEIGGAIGFILGILFTIAILVVFS